MPAGFDDAEGAPDGLEARILRGGRGLLPAGARVLCAVSGGADSAALAAALSRLAPRLGLAELALCHVDHQLRASSKTDAEFARRLAAALGLPFELRAVQVARGEGPEAGARRARYAALSALAQELGADRVAVGHSRTDQAETVLLRLLRGAGPRGLAAMAPARPLAPGVTLVRPLLAISRARVRAYAARLELPTCEDPTNADPRFQRNALRALWPALLCLSPGLERRLASLARICRDDEAALGDLAAAALDGLRALGERDGISARALAELPPAVGRRVLRRLVASRSPAAQLDAEQVERLLGLVRRGTPGALHVAGDLEARLWKGALSLRPRQRGAAPAPLVFSREIPGEGRWPCPEAGVALRVTACAGAAEPAGTLRLCIAQAAVRFPLVLRNRRPGDRFRPSGAPGSRKLKSFLIDSGVPRGTREGLALLCQGSEILWVVGQRAGASARWPVAGEAGWLIEALPLGGLGAGGRD